ncbi:MAG: shikimate dehydrogenase [Pseudomonadota bacterium]
MKQTDSGQIRAGVVGWPIKHSRSPLIHRHWLNQHNLNGTYDRHAVAPDVATDFFGHFASHGWAGCNVTVPHKETAYAAADRRDASAQAVGAANTLWLEDGQLCAANTDTYGFMEHLKACCPDWADTAQHVAILGAGGAARAIVYGFMMAGAPRISILNRTKRRADDLIAAFDHHKSLGAIDWEQRHNIASFADVIVNTTTVGMDSAGPGGASADASPNALPSNLIDLTRRENPNRAIVCDIVYVPLLTPLLKHAKENGHKTVDGLGMLLHQAVPGFEKWFGVRPSVTDELRDLIIADLDAEQC